MSQVDSAPGGGRWCSESKQTSHNASNPPSLPRNRPGTFPPFEQPESEVEQPREPRHGDLAAPIALRLARSVPHPPLDIAHAIVRHLSLPTYISGVAVAPPDFINFRLQDSFPQQQVDAILREGDAYGNLNLGQGKRV